MRAFIENSKDERKLAMSLDDSLAGFDKPIAKESVVISDLYRNIAALSALDQESFGVKILAEANDPLK